MGGNFTSPKPHKAKPIMCFHSFYFIQSHNAYTEKAINPYLESLLPLKHNDSVRLKL